MNLADDESRLTQRYAMVIAARSLTEQGWSLRQVATALGRSHEWVRLSLAVNIELTPVPMVRFEENHLDPLGEHA